MRAATWDIEHFSLQLQAPLVTGNATHTHRRGFLIHVAWPDGVRGTGECTPLLEFHTEDLATAEREARRALDRLPETAPSSMESIRVFCESVPTPAARHGVELALLDAACRARGEPLHRFLGGARRPMVEVSALLPSLAAEQTAAGLLEDGWRNFKLKVGALGVQADLARVAAVRAVIGRSALRLDANGCWTEEEALDFLERAAPFNIKFCEQPTPAADVAMLHRVTRHSPIPIAADEALAFPGARDTIVDGGAANILVLKPMVLGGILNALALARRGAAAGLGSVVTSSLDGVLARAAATHLAGVLPGTTFAAGLATGALFEAEGPDPLAPDGGWITLPVAPGVLP